MNIDVSKLPVMPSVTGYPQLDTLIRGVFIGASVWATTKLLDALGSHGVNVSDYYTLVAGAIFSSLVTAATLIWGFIQAQLTKKAIATHIVAAVVTQQISPAVTKVMTPAQEIQVTRALNLQQVNKDIANATAK